MTRVIAARSPSIVSITFTETEPPTTWNINTGEGIQWKVPVEGLALASPIIWGDKLFLTTAVGENSNPKFEPDPTFGYGIQREKDVWQWKVICFDKLSGRRLWERVAHEGTPQHGRHSESTHANATPATDGTNIVTMFGSEGLFCYGMNGALRWKTDLCLLSASPDGHPDLEWGYSSSPIIHNDKVILQCDVQGGCFISVVDLKSGKELKRIPRADVPTFATPNVHTVSGRDQVICNGYKEVAAYDLESGQKIWWFQSRGDMPVPRPVFAHNLIYITSAHGGRNLLAIRPEAVGNLAPARRNEPNPAGIAWYNERQGSYIPTPIVYEGILYVPNERGVMAAFEPTTGAEFYEERIVARQGGSYYASPVAASGKIYVTANNGDIHVIRAGRRFKKLATNEMEEPTMATPAISAAQLYIRTRSQLYCIGTPKQ